MMFGDWPGPAPPPTPAPLSNQLQLLSCNSKDKAQQWTTEGSALSLATGEDEHGYHNCVDIGKCSKAAGEWAPSV
jgi:hypothetical protein